jgi:hypothetical protein
MHYATSTMTSACSTLLRAAFALTIPNVNQTLTVNAASAKQIAFRATTKFLSVVMAVLLIP